MNESTKNDGGPAYPEISTIAKPDRAGGIMHVHGTSGMSLRNYLAGQALSNPKICEGADAETDARYAYQWADAMLRIGSQ